MAPMLNSDHLKAAALVCAELEKLGEALAKSSNVGLFHLDDITLNFEGERIGTFRAEDDWWNYFPATP